MAKSLKQILGGRNITAATQGVKGGLPINLPAEFFTTTENIEGDIAEWFKINGSRRTARLVLYGGASKAADLQGVSSQTAKMIHTFEHQDHRPSALKNLLSPAGGKQQQGRDSIGRQIGEFRRRFVNLRTAAVMQMLALGKIYFDGDGNLLPSSSGAVFTVDFQIPAGNKNQLDVFGAGAIIGASWGTAGTDILGDLRALKKAAKKKTGYPLMYAFYGENIPGYINSNTVIKEYLSRSPRMQEAVYTGDIPDGLGGLTWIPVDDSFYEDQDGSIQDLVGGDTVIFTPAVDPSWYGLMQGSYDVPAEASVVGESALDALDVLEEVFGMFGYAEITTDPPTIRQYGGDTFLPCLKVPEAVFIADVTP